jgi:hypothetical protein
MAKHRSLHICVDRVVPHHHKEEAMKIAVSENRDNEPLDLTRRPGASAHPAKIALFAGKLWSNGRVLGVRFLDGSKIQRKKTIEHAEKWSHYANVRFNFAAGAKAEIRVSFRADGDSWSAIGTDCQSTPDFPKGTATMNFGWLRDDSDDVEWNRVVVHEFGHALGAIHEHQNPKAGIKWKLAAVYKYFAGPPNHWSKDDTYYNVVQKYSVDQLNATNFDPASIMLYSFPGALVVGGKGTPENTDLSAGDKAFIAKQYPK